MSSFHVFLIGSAEPIQVDFGVADVAELVSRATYSRYILGKAQDEDGAVKWLALPTNRIQLIAEC